MENSQRVIFVEKFQNNRASTEIASTAAALQKDMDHSGAFLRVRAYHSHQLAFNYIDERSQ